jgi:hypothetical protein
VWPLRIGTEAKADLARRRNAHCRDSDANPIDPTSADANEEAVAANRRTTLAARLKAIYGSVDDVDAFVGMVAEPHVPGTELGELQRAIWTRQFAALRDGDRFFYLTDAALPQIGRAFGVTYRHSLAEIIRRDTGESVQADVFKVENKGDAAPSSATDKQTTEPPSVDAGDRAHPASGTGSQSTDSGNGPPQPGASGSRLPTGDDNASAALRRRRRADRAGERARPTTRPEPGR